MYASNNSSLNSSVFCETLYYGRIYIQPKLKFFLVFFMASSMTLNLTLNVGVIWALIATKQLKTTSLRLLLSLSVSDVFLAVIGQTLFLLMLINPGDGTSCFLDTIAEFFVMLFAHTSAWVIVLIGFDRLFRMKYMNRYSTKVKMWHLYAALGAVSFLALFETSIEIIGIQFHFYDVAYFIAIGLDSCIFLLLWLPYVMTICVVNSQRKGSANTQIFAKVDKIVSKMASRIVTTIIIMYAPYVIFCSSRVVLSKMGLRGQRIMATEWYNFCLFAGYELAIANSFINAIIFVSLNKKTQRMLKQCFAPSITNQRIHCLECTKGTKFIIRADTVSTRI